MGRPGSRHRSCGAVGPLASGQWATAIADHRPLTEAGWTRFLGVLERERGGVASVLGPPPLFPVPGPKACLHDGGRLAPRGPMMTEPPWAAGRCRAEGWAPGLVEPGGAVAISSR